MTYKQYATPPMPAHIHQNRPLPLVVALSGALLLAGCASKKEEQVAAEAPAQASTTATSGTSTGGFMTGATPGAGSGRFAAPTITGQGAPPLASVPEKAPTPPASRAEREKTIEGLIADRDRASHTDSGGRTLPVVVRPLSETAAQPDVAAPAPTKPQAAPAGSVTRLGDQPPPGQKPATTEAAVETAAKVAATATPPALPDMNTGPRAPMVASTRNDGFRTLATYEATGSKSVVAASVDFSGGGANLTPVGRQALSDAAKASEGKTGAIRVIGRAAEASNLVQERATAVARELQRLGVTQDRIFVGTDTGPDGRVDVILDQ